MIQNPTGLTFQANPHPATKPFAVADSQVPTPPVARRLLRKIRQRAGRDPGAARQPVLLWRVIDEETDPDPTAAARFGENIPLEAATTGRGTRPVELLLIGFLLATIIGYVTWQEVKAYSRDAAGAAPGAPPQAEAMQPEQSGAQLALIEVTIDPTALNALPVPYRSKRFYRQVAGVWQPITPGVAAWGEMRTLETEHFRWEFYALDAPAVATVAAELDGLWQTLHRQVALAQPTAQEKLLIQVLSNSGPHRRTLDPFQLPAALPVSSPTLLPIPLLLTEADMLRGNIVRHLASLALFRKIAPASRDAWWGNPGVQGLLRWLIAQGGVQPVTTSYYHVLQQAWQRQTAAQPTPHLADIMGRQRSSAQQNRFWVEMELERNAVTATSVIDYALTTYGQQHLPPLIEAIGKQTPWTAIVPTVFGVSIETFEDGWHAALAQR